MICLLNCQYLQYQIKFRAKSIEKGFLGDNQSRHKRVFPSDNLMLFKERLKIFFEIVGLINLSPISHYLLYKFHIFPILLENSQLTPRKSHLDPCRRCWENNASQSLFCRLQVLGEIYHHPNGIFWVFVRVFEHVRSVKIMRRSCRQIVVNDGRLFMSLDKLINLVLALVISDIFVVAPILSTSPLHFPPQGSQPATSKHCEPSLDCSTEFR